MKRFRTWLTSLTVLLLQLAVKQALGWDDAGHLLIAQIAYGRLTAALQQKLQGELSGLTEGAHTYNAISAACYMDDLRRDKHLFGSWHFIAPPFTASGKPLPPTHNVVWALSYCTSVYQGQVSDSSVTKPEALAMVMHLVGDVHQPLHCTTHADRSGKDDGNGNAVVVTNMPDALYQNLHSFWDSAFQRAYVDGQVKKLYSLSRPAAVSPNALQDRTGQLIHAFAPGPFWRLAGRDPAKWALKSHSLGYRYGYRSLAEGDDAKSVTLTADYVTQANRVASQQIVLAGYRLADLLQRIIPNT